MPRSKDEFRRHPRKTINVPVILDVDRIPLTTRSLNVSSNGIALYKPAHTPIAPGQQVTVRFSEPRSRAVTARVIHVGEAEIGLIFDEEDPAEKGIEAPSEAALTSTEALQKAGPAERALKWLTRHSRRAAIMAINTPLQPLIIQWVNPEFLFAAYGTPKEAARYMAPWMKKILPGTIICGLIRADGRTGLMVATTEIEDTLQNNAIETRSYLHDLATRFPRAKRIALVGRLPNFARKAGVTLQKPFVDGSLGTRFMILEAARQMHALPRFRHLTGITVLGGAGRIGDQVCQDLLREFAVVIAYDPRYAEEEVMDSPDGRLIRTSSLKRLREHRMFIGLTHHGEAIRVLANHLPEGGMIADDTHPCIGLATRRLLAKRGIDTMKIVLTHPRFTLQPRMPAWNSQDIPGCLVEALVLLNNGDIATRDFQQFSSIARLAGFQGTLVAPPQD